MEQSYKEKYEQAIERLKQWDREHPCAGYVLSDRDKFIFPELAESEGEKVRKELIKHLKELSDWKEDEVIPVKNPSYYRQWVSWLENIPYTIDHEKREGFHLGYKACHEEQSEQKPIEENKGNVGGISPNRWKPSEDDIIILEKVFNGKIDPKDFQATLLNVLEQLKKLKEGKV